MTNAEMPSEVWEYTPTGRSWEYRYAEETPFTVTPSSSKASLRPLDVAVFALLACLAMFFAHEFRAQRVHAASELSTAPAAAVHPEFANYYNCKLMLPGVQPEQTDGDPTHTQFHPYNYTVCDGVRVTLWSETR